ncbi:foldase [Bacillus sp. BGMRC 2118]|nr:foldase [Bacillus sp. BGMRC 2118]
MRLVRERWGLVVVSAVIVVGVIVSVLLTTKTEVVAKVGSDSISKEELYDAMVMQYGADTLDKLISDRIIELEVKKEKVTATDEEVGDELQSLIESYGSEESFNEALATSGLSLSDAKKEIKTFLLTEKLLSERVTVSDEEIKTYFEENKDEFGQAEQVQASHILVVDESTAQEVLAKVKAGEDFATLAEDYSTDTATAETGGDLGYFGRGEMTTEFDEAAFSLSVGSVSDPVKTEYGYHIIKVTDKKEAKEATLEESKEEIKETLLDEKISSEYTVWLEEKMKDYNITNSLSDES